MSATEATAGVYERNEIPSQPDNANLPFTAGVKKTQRTRLHRNSRSARLLSRTC